MREVGYGQGYRYAHAEPEGVGGIECLPESLKGRRYYRPRASGEEADLARRLEAVLQKRREKWAREEASADDSTARRRRRTRRDLDASPSAGSATPRPKPDET
jgi:hypothetical protein